MLVLTRREGNAVVLTTPGGEKIEVYLVKIKGKQARIGIEAAKNVIVMRKEAADAIAELEKPLPEKVKA